MNSYSRITLKLLSYILCGMLFYKEADAVERFMVHYANDSNTRQANRSSAADVAKISGLRKNAILETKQIIGDSVSVDVARSFPDGTDVIVLNHDISEPEFQRLKTKLENSGGVSSVEIDTIVKPHALYSPNSQQWDMFGIVNGNHGDNFYNAWSILNNSTNTSAGNNTIVAVIDSGYTPHQSLLANLQQYTNSACNSLNGLNSNCYGYQFISDCRLLGANSAYQQNGCPASTSSNTLISPVPDALDTGDWITSSENSSGYFAGCGVSNSIWHGTHVSGIIGGIGYTNGSSDYITGGAYGAKILPVRVLGKCGGYSSDIISGIYWSINDLSGYPNNHPAQVINMSLGGEFDCTSSYQDAINAALRAGTVVVTSAGNATQNISGITPAGCTGVIAVGAKDRNNNLAGYSNYGDGVSTVASGSSVYSTVWGSTQGYSYNSAYNIYSNYNGTSMSAPHVSALAADMISYMQGNGYTWSPAVIKSIIENYSTTLSSNCYYSGLCTPNRALDAESVINYIVNYYRASLYPSSLTHMNQANNQVTVTFTNNSSHSVSVSSWLQVGGKYLTVYKAGDASCIGHVIGAGSSCSQIFRVNQTVNGVNFSAINLYGSQVSSSSATSIKQSSTTNPTIVGSAYVEVDSASSPSTAIPSEAEPTEDGSEPIVDNPPSDNSQTTTSSGGGGGGGCSSIQNGSDSSLLLMFMFLSVTYLGIRLSRFIIRKSKNDKINNKSNR